MLSHYGIFIRQNLEVAVGGGTVMKNMLYSYLKFKEKHNIFAHQTSAYGASYMRLLFGNTVKLLETTCHSCCPGASWGPGQ